MSPLTQETFDPRQFELERTGSGRSTGKAPIGCLDFAGRLVEHVLWIEGWLAPPLDGPIRLRLSLPGEHRVETQALATSFARQDLPGPDSKGLIVLVALDPDLLSTEELRSVALFVSGSWYRWSPSEGLAISPDLPEWWAKRLPSLPDDARERISLLMESDWPDFEHVTRQYELVALPSRLELFGSLERIGRQSTPTTSASPSARSEDASRLFRPHPSFHGSPTDPTGLSIDTLIALGPDAAFVRGWAFDAARPPDRLAWHCPPVSDRDVLSSLATVPRPDVAEIYRPHFPDHLRSIRGFLGLLKPEAAVDDWSRSVFSLETARGEVLRASPPPVVTDPFDARELLFRTLPDERFVGLELIRSELVECHDRLQTLCRQAQGEARSFSFGDAKGPVEWSLVIPTAGRPRYLEAQLALLSGDPAVRRCEIVVVADEGCRDLRIQDSLHQLSELNGIVIRLLTLPRHAGYAAAVNKGVELSRAESLLLMHDDVIPGDRGWIEALGKALDSCASVGIVGPRLLSEDGSISSAGLRPVQGRHVEPIWELEHLQRGLPAPTRAEHGLRPVHGISGACLAIRKQLFEELGGFSDSYAAGFFEDADLGLRCLQQGLEVFLVEESSVHHLEQRARPWGLGWTDNRWTRLFNHHLFTERWSHFLHDLADEPTRGENGSGDPVSPGGDP